MEEIKHALIDLGWILSVPLIAACLLWCANEIYYRSFGRYKHKAILVTGLIGTPIHEISHAITATLFGMKVTKIALYSPDPQSQTLGYVTYRYNPASFIHRVGMLFTGLSPLLFGAYIVYYLFNLAEMPNLHSYFVLSNHRGLSSSHSTDAIASWYQALISSLSTWGAWAKILVAVMIGVHSTPSAADLKGSIQGATAVIAVIVAYWGAVRLFSDNPSEHINRSVEILNHVSTAILQLALLSVLFAMLMTLLGMVISQLFTGKPKVMAGN